jgi:hypothetical protein
MATITTSSCTKYGKVCERLELETGGRFYWAEETWQRAGEYAVYHLYHWSDQVGPVLLRSWLTREQAQAELEGLARG